MFATLEFVMVSFLFADLAVRKGAQFVAWVKSEVQTVESTAQTVKSDVNKL